MIRDELYINNIKADLGKTDINLNYKSSLLTDISKIVSNSSYTIKLPKTSKNLALIDCTHLPSATSRYPYLIHKGTLLRNGIVLIKDANIVLFETGEYIEIALTWGNVTNFANVTSGDKKLTDLDYGTDSGTDYAVWYKREWYTFPYVNYGFKDGEENAWYHPVVTVKWVLDKIAKSNGVVFDIPAEKSDLFSSWIIPLLTRNEADRQVKQSELTLSVDETTAINTGGETFLYRGIGFIYPENYNFNYYGTFEAYTDSQGRDYWTHTYKTAISNAKINLKGRVTIRVSSPNGSPDGLKFALMNRYTASSILSVSPSKVTHLSGNVYDVIYEIDGQSDVVEGTRQVDFAFIEGPGGMTYYNSASGSITFSAQADMILLRTSNKNDGRFYFVPNLPDIKQIDFIKAIMSMAGLFALPDGDNRIRFVAFDDLKANISNALDWTSRLIKAYTDTAPRNMKYVLDNIAQNNRFIYKEDNSLKGNYDGNITVNDATIDYERDAIKLPFSACDTKDGLPYIPLYSYNDNGELEYSNKSNPRILIQNKLKGVFRGLEWSTLIAKHYQTYKELINDAKVVTEYIRLTSLELCGLEMDVPVYLGQYGCYFAIIELKTKGNDICECKLLKI